MARRLPTGITRASNRTGYLVQVCVRGHRRSARFQVGTPLEDMRDWQDRERRELRRAVPGASLQAGTFGADVQTYLHRWHADAVHPETRKQRVWYLTLWAARFDGRRRHSIRTDEIADQLAYWRDHGLPLKPMPDGHRRRRTPPTHLAPATVAKVRQAIYQLYRVLDRGTGRANPVSEVELPPARPLEVRGVSMALVDAVFAHLPTGASRDRLALMAYAGLRPCEVMRITPHDFCDGVSPTLLVRTAKGGHASTLPLLPEAATAVRQLLASHALGVFTSAPIGRILHSACARVTTAQRLSPPLHLRPYDLRHSFGSAVLGAADQRTAQAALRHASITTTHRYTLQAVPARVQTALKVIETRLPVPPADESAATICIHDRKQA